MNNVERLIEIEREIAFLSDQNEKLLRFLKETNSPIEKTNLTGRIEMNQDEIFKMFDELAKKLRSDWLPGLIDYLPKDDIDMMEPKL